MLRSLAEKRGQQLTVQCECTDRVVMGDENRLKQILINIISNAIKYTDIGGHIALRLESLPEYRYADFEELTPAMLRDLIEKIIVHEAIRAADTGNSELKSTTPLSVWQKVRKSL